MALTVGPDRWVTLRYRLFDAQGEPVEPGERELTYLHGGYGAVFARIEEALEGKGAGEAATVYLEPQESFGDYDPELVRLAPRDLFPEELEVGMSFDAVPGERADDLIHIVTDFSDDTVVLDANHPLAGMALRFELRVLDVREASAEEIEREREVAGRQ